MVAKTPKIDGRLPARAQTEEAGYLSGGPVPDATTSLRRQMMQSIKRAGTTPEMRVRRALFAAGHRYRVNVRGMPGTPDIVLSGRHLAIFVHGCFWHRHEGCRFATTPRTRAEFWQDKFARNVARDADKRRLLEDDGWRVVEVWECAVKDGSFAAPLLELVTSLPPVARRRR
ncbi:very short patch repair endonuclease [Marinivivus vitaminiproducens]|uniref:very short patch repair endonuclease n=1 Tax=Marinivivus vitaminiproducens TaxID=3035935 RepID=UPI0027A5031A|nr:very short patch repair endonuclease [Geminicoccaceae bacterium SCSIO 64248]